MARSPNSSFEGLMLPDDIKPSSIVRGRVILDPTEGIAAVRMGASVKLIGMARSLNQTYQLILNVDQAEGLGGSPGKLPFDVGPSFTLRSLRVFGGTRGGR